MITFTKTPAKTLSLVSFGVKDIGPYYWVGTGKNQVEYMAGQTFKSPASGVLKSIKVFSAVVFGSSNTSLSVYNFDTLNHTFAEKKSETTKMVNKAVENQWLEFAVSNVPVVEGAQYAFKIECKGGGMIGIAECPWSIQDPYADGEEWVGSSFCPNGIFQKDFDLAFEAEIDTSLNAKFI